MKNFFSNIFTRKPENKIKPKNINPVAEKNTKEKKAGINRREFVAAVASVPAVVALDTTFSSTAIAETPSSAPARYKAVQLETLLGSENFSTVPISMQEIQSTSKEIIEGILHGNGGSVLENLKNITDGEVETLFSIPNGTYFRRYRDSSGCEIVGISGPDTFSPHLKILKEIQKGVFVSFDFAYSRSPELTEEEKINLQYVELTLWVTESLHPSNHVPENENYLSNLSADEISKLYPFPLMLLTITEDPNTKQERFYPPQKCRLTFGINKTNIDSCILDPEIVQNSGRLMPISMSVPKPSGGIILDLVSNVTREKGVTHPAAEQVARQISKNLLTHFVALG